MNKSTKILSIFLMALIILSVAGFVVSYHQGKKDSVGATALLAASEKASGQAVPSSEIKSKNDATQRVMTTTNSASEPDLTLAVTAGKTEYPFNYAGVNPVLTKITEENWNLMLINSDYYIPKAYSDNVNLVIAVEGYPAKLDARVAGHYKEMFDAAKKDGITLRPTSVNGGYRTVATQQRFFEEKIARYGKADEAAAVKKAARINQPPCCSEHNAGLAMDIYSTITNTKEFQQVFDWLSKNAANYGFIMRYPENKSDITGVMYEPWHWRFVGLEHAPKIKVSKLCLEEYLETL